MFKVINKILLALVVIAVCYLLYGFYQMRQEFFQVYETEPQYVIADEGADVTVVGFMQYGCQRCHDFEPYLEKALEQDGRIRYIPRFVTYGQVWQETLAASVYAAAHQDKFAEMYRMIFEKWPIEDRETLFAYAKGLGIDTKKLSRDMSSNDIIEKVRQDQLFFDAWRLKYTPALLVGQKYIFRPMSKESLNVNELLDRFDQAR